MTDTITEDILNPSCADFDTEFYLKSPDFLNGKLRRENCYNPLIAHEISKLWNRDYSDFLINLIPVEMRLALQILRNYPYEAWKDVETSLKRGAGKFKEIHETGNWEFDQIQVILTAVLGNDEWKEKLRTPEDFCAALIGNELIRFYPPREKCLTDKEFLEKDQINKAEALSNIFSLAFNWQMSLGKVRQGIENEKTWTAGHVIGGLEDIYKALEKIRVPFIDFLQFRGIFELCHWLWRSQENTPPGYFQDIIYYPINRMEKMPPQGWNTFSTIFERPKDKLTEFYGTHADVDTSRIGAYGFKNPYAEIIQGNINENTFLNASELMIGEFMGRKKTAETRRTAEQKPVVMQEDTPNNAESFGNQKFHDSENSPNFEKPKKTVFVNITPYCSLNQHCKVLGLQNHSIFANSAAWKKLKETSPSQKRGHWTLYGLNGDELFGLYTNYCIRNNMISPDSPRELFKMYKNNGQSLD